MAHQQTRRQFLRQGALLTALAAGAAPRYASAATKARPNIVLILADDLGYGDPACYGGSYIRTPALDRLAAEGVRLTANYANAPECTPTRTALLTGRYQQRVGGLECALGIGNVGRYDDAIRLREKRELGLPTSEITIASMLKYAGYTTAICGKWHLGYEPKFFPLKHGFDYWFGPVGGGTDYFHHCEYTGEHALYKNDKPVKREGYLTHLISQEAVGFIERQTSKPFFLYVPYNAPHTPYQGPNDKKPDYVREKDFNKGTRNTFIEMVQEMDRGIGEILEALEKKGVAKNTLVIFLSDNGANKTGRNAPFSGYKGSLSEGGIRVPGLVKWPGRLRAGSVSEQVCITMDFTCSIARVAGVQPWTKRPFEGIDILNILEGKAPPQSRTLFWRARRGDLTRKAVRKDSLKYLWLKNGDTFEEHLYDLARDPAEKQDLINIRTADAQNMRFLLNRWERQVRPSR